MSKYTPRFTEEFVKQHQAKHGKGVVAVAEAVKPKKKPNTTRRTKLEQSLTAQLERIDVPEWVEEYKFHSIRDWRFDFAWPDLQIAVEVEGLIHNATQGGHQTMKGYTANCEKYNEATLWNWQVYRFTNPMVKSGEAAVLIQRALTRRANQ